MWTDTIREESARKGLGYSSDFKNAEWAALERLPPLPRRLRRARKWMTRDMLNGVLYQF